MLFQIRMPLLMSVLPSAGDLESCLPYDQAGGLGPCESQCGRRLGEGHHLEIFQEIHFPHSLGLLYSAVTYYTGFKVNSGEYKVMGLAPYGQPKYAKTILDNLIDVKPDGSYRLNMSYFDYCTGLTMTNERFAKLFGAPVRSPDKLLTPFHMDVAASIQAVLDEIVLKMTRNLAKQTGSRNLCLAGGVALNCVTNGKVLRDGKFGGGRRRRRLGRSARCGPHLQRHTTQNKWQRHYVGGVSGPKFFASRHRAKACQGGRSLCGFERGGHD